MTEKDLKNALLQEAVQGKLVPQIASEGNARDLLNEIRNEKSKLIKEGNLKKEKPLPELKEEEIPFDIPENWCWCRVGDIFQHNTGKAMNSSAKEINKTGSIRKFITTSNLYWNEFDFTNVKEMFFSDDELHRCTVTKGDILINEGGAYFGRTAIWDYDYDICFQNHVHRLRPFVEIERLYFYYIFYLYRNTNRMQSKGTAMPGLSSEVLHSTIIPLPPLAEQKRIVDAIEKFMPLIEEYGKKETELKALNEQIGTLTKKAILQEAVQGKLVPQIAAEGNARDLLEEIRKERLSHGFDFANAKSGKRKSKKETALAGSNPCDISDDEIPFDIPENWCWCRLGEVTEIARGGSPRPIKDYLTTDESGYNWIKIGDTDKNGKYINQTSEKIVKEGLDKTRLVHKGDFLLTNSMSFGRPYILNIDGCIHDGWLVISPKGNIFNKDFLYYVLSSTFAYNQFCDSVSGAVVKNLNSDKVRESLFPLPPLGEQKRIVAAIEKMLPLCEKLGE